MVRALVLLANIFFRTSHACFKVVHKGDNGVSEELILMTPIVIVRMACGGARGGAINEPEKVMAGEESIELDLPRGVIRTLVKLVAYKRLSFS